MIVGGFYSEVTLQKREAEGTVHTKHELKLDPDPEGSQKWYLLFVLIVRVPPQVVYSLQSFKSFSSSQAGV